MLVNNVLGVCLYVFSVEPHNCGGKNDCPNDQHTYYKLATSAETKNKLTFKPSTIPDSLSKQYNMAAEEYPEPDPK